MEVINRMLSYSQRFDAFLISIVGITLASEFTGHIYLDHEFKTIDKIGKRMCQKECEKYSKCDVFKYSAEWLSCTLVDIDTKSSRDGASENDYEMTVLDRRQQVRYLF